MTPTLPLVGEEIAGYKLYAVLGRGGMSVVYQAEHPRLSSTVALKILAPELATDDVFRARFLQESRIAASVNHPNVIPIYDTGPAGDLLYIAMRYVAGADLRAVLKERGRISGDQALLLIGQAGRALDAAHRHGLVHRDVKPANILIERGADDDPDHVYLADFGITKHALERSGLTATGQFVGTIDYMAPEQIRGQPIDGRADIYALGCVLYECLTGTVPFRKEVDAAVLWAHVEEPPPPPSAVCPDLPGAVDEVVARALAKAPDDRYQTCRDMITAARAALGGGDPSTSAEPSRPATVLGDLPQRSAQDQSAAVAQPARPGTVRSPVMRDLSVPGAAGADSGRTLTGSRDETVQRRRPGAPPPEPPPGPKPARWQLRIGGAVAVVLIAGAAAAVALTGGGTPKRPASKPTHTNYHSNAVLQALQASNRSDTAKGLVPPSSCQAQGATRAVCTHPAFGADEATFETFGSLNALYVGYLQAISTVAPRRFHSNFGDCTEQKISGEVSWNHNYQHPRHFSLAQSRSGHLSDDQGAGRVFCTFTNGRLHIIWTQNDGRLLGIVSGAPHGNTWDWWKGVHHSISLPGSGPGTSMS